MLTSQRDDCERGHHRAVGQLGCASDQFCCTAPRPTLRHVTSSSAPNVADEPSWFGKLIFLVSLLRFASFLTNTIKHAD